MYFEPTKRTYYRFPSSNSINDLDSRFYFPEKPQYSEEDTRYDAQIMNHVPSRKTNEYF